MTLAEITFSGYWSGSPSSLGCCFRRPQHFLLSSLVIFSVPYLPPLLFCFQLSEAMGPDVTTSQLLPLYVRLLQDSEAEVRAASVKNAAAYCDLVGKDKFADEVIPALRNLSEDPAQNVRVGVAESVMELAPKLGSAKTTSLLIPMVVQFLRDEAPEVRGLGLFATNDG